MREILGINRSSVFRLVNTLRRRGFLANPAGSSEFVIGPSAWRLHRKHDWSLLIGLCRPHLRTLALQSGETAHLAVREGKRALFIDHQAASHHVLVVSGRTGEFMPLLHGAW